MAKAMNAAHGCKRDTVVPVFSNFLFLRFSVESC